MVISMPLRVYGHKANSRRIASSYKRLGVDGVEVDVNVRRGEIVVLHGHPHALKTRAGRVLEFIDNMLYYGDPLLHRPKPLSEWLEELWSMGFKRVLLDVKGSVDPDILVDVVESSWPGEVGVSGENHRILRMIGERSGRIRVYPTLTIAPADPVALLRAAGAHGASVRLDIAEVPGVVESIKEAGLEVIVWTVNDRRDLEKVRRLGADAVVSDKPEALMECAAARMRRARGAGRGW